MRCNLLMKNLFLILCALWGFAACHQSPRDESPQKAGIEFLDITLDSAFALAAKNQSLVFLDVYADWCKPCKKMAKEVFTLPEVFEFFNTQFVNLKLDIEDSGDGTALAFEYNIKILPTYLFLNPEGRIIHKTKGMCSAEEFIANARKAINEASGSQ